ncbi:MBL fold metallo-hydrolase [Pedobacter alluvionis]|uniref:L-ascorbate metabolism protein UlaG (Beta-lactamase superfamily) n=1 Tax=Pedobacter alluvionis TaxID=475253 RepID=A0A497Y012_9SPHI|nr:MBL fold metallo-hydrolase [Pedobacter alluvionis]RLJ72736.1 L-ascorbate metabolism protein UlaG (beta-lactamase superfamily) [Pedobacter alluvionis]TFB29424.1 MBL fold metallo-hydrolase [Pedobacter alluvionis]
MNTEKWFLKPNLIIEPLVEKWYAWTHLISPATAAMNIAGRHLKIMNSYLQSPQIHAVAILNPKMLGGPFMDYKGGRLDEVRQLKEETLHNHADSLKLVAAINELDKILKTYAKGYGLEEIYKQVPDILKGYVELTYDLNNNASFRFFEALLYKSEFYKKTAQSIALWLTDNDERPFCLSTPRLNEPNVLQLNIPFDHEGIDLLSKMKREGGTIEDIASLLGVSAAERQLFESFFTQTPHPKYEKYEGDKVRMRYFGHACILIETKDVSILVDPLISYYGYESSVNHFSDVDLPDIIDYVLITHNHQDHILFETLLPLRHKIKQVIVPGTNSGSLQDPNLKLVFNQIGFSNVVEIDEMETISFKNCTITGIPFTGEHSDLNILAKTCYHVEIGSFTFLFVADSRIVEPRIYEHVQRVIGDVDVIFLGMECEGAPLSWLYGPLLTEDLARDKDQSRRLSGSDYEKGMQLVNVFHPKEVYVYAMGQEPWLEFISSIKYTEESKPIVQSNQLLNECLQRGLVAERLFGEKELFYHYNTCEIT